MLRLRKFLKPYLIPLLIAVVCLFGQAFSELNLPTLMGNIVDVGIQQAGISSPAPDSLDSDAYHTALLLMSEPDREKVEKAYTLQSAGTGDSSKYPEAQNKDIYVKNQNLSDMDLEEVERAFSKSSYSLVALLQQMSKEKGETFDTSDVNLKLDFKEILSELSAMPKDALDQVTQIADKLEDSMISQTGTVVAKFYYKALGVDVAKMQSTYILNTGIKMLGLTLFGALMTIIVGFSSARIAGGVARDLRKGVFSKVERFSLAEFDQFSTASLITRTTNDVNQVQMLLVMAVRMIIYSPIMAVGGIIMISRTDTSMTWILAVVVVALIVLFAVIMGLSGPGFKRQQKLTDRVNLVAREDLTGQMVIRAFGNQDFENERFDDANVNLRKTNRFINRIMAIMVPSVTLLMNLATVLIVWVGSHQIADSQLQIGSMMAFIQYAMQIIFSFIMVAVIFILIPRASVSANRIADVLETEPSVEDPENAKPFVEDKTGWVEFSHVDFQYPEAEEKVLSDISFVAKPGQTTAIIGSTGSGKTTLVSLIPRLYDCTGGNIKISGQDVRDVKMRDLRQEIGYVPQQSMLLSGTIRSNLSYGRPDAATSELEAAVETAQASDFISKMEDGIDSPITEGATNVSGGQKQRISIARALAKQSPIYVFDDSFSALDFKTDSNLRKALHKYAKNSTIILVAQRVSTILQAEQILVLDEGKIVGKGTHEELLKNCPTYYEIASSQLRKEEL